MRTAQTVILAVALLAGCATTAPPGRPLAQDDLAALYWAADSGNVEAQYRLGAVYGRGTAHLAQDYDQALVWLSRAAGNGHTRAQQLYADWTSGDKARELVIAGRSALDNGHEDYGLPLLEQLAKAGVAEAAYALGRHYLAQTPPQPWKARPWLEDGARAGDANARYLLGALWAEGALGPARPGEAARYWQACAAQGHAMCQYGLGLLHVAGNGVDHDIERGRGLIRRAAEQGYDRASGWLERLDRLCGESSDRPPACR